MDLVVPDRAGRSAKEPSQPWTTPKFSDYLRDLARVAPKAGVRMNVPYGELSEQEKRVILEGTGDFKGIYGFFRFVEKKAYKIYYRVLLSRYRGYTTCQVCGGSRLRREALNVRVGGKTIADVVRMTIAEARGFLDDLAAGRGGAGDRAADPERTPQAAGVPRRRRDRIPVA